MGWDGRGESKEHLNCSMNSVGDFLYTNEEANAFILSEASPSGFDD